MRSRRYTQAVTVVRLDAPETECIICGQTTAKAQGIPLFEGCVVPVDSDGDWAGFDACSYCFGLYEEGRYVELQAILDTRGPSCPGPGCSRCSGEFCETHGVDPCGCDCIDRHEILPGR